MASCACLPLVEGRLPCGAGGGRALDSIHTSKPPSRRNTAWHHDSHPATHRPSAHATATPDPRPAPLVSYVSVHRAVVSPEKSTSLLVLVLEVVDTKPTWFVAEASERGAQRCGVLDGGGVLCKNGCGGNNC